MSDVEKELTDKKFENDKALADKMAKEIAAERELDERG
jgi:hypothetical protein